MKNNLISILSMVLIAGLLSGCTASVFHEPVTVSMRSAVARYAEPIGPVSAEYTNRMFIIIPIPVDPRNVYDDLLDKAKAEGGNAVIDLQLQNKSTFMWMFPVIMSDTWELTGTAVKID